MTLNVNYLDRNTTRHTLIIIIIIINRHFKMHK